MEQIDNYKIVKKIGEGGMGEVYKGVDVMLEREVAIKLLKPELSNRDDIVQRFRSEAIALGRLNHPSIAAVYNFGRFNTQFYMALEFVNGETLDDVIKKNGALAWQTALHYAIAILQGLEHAHRFQIIHRDIKPSNIIITEQDTVKILDFGMARILEKARQTISGNLIGTLEYVSPEQIRGQETDARSDIYSVGVVLYEMLTGHIPFEKNTEYDLIKSQIEEKPKPPRSFSQAIPPQIEQLVLKALEKKPERRFASANDFADALQKLVEHPPIARKQTSFGWALRFCRDYPAIVFLLALLAIGGGYFLWLSGGMPTIGGLNPNATFSSVNQLDGKQQLPESTVGGASAQLTENAPLPPPSDLQPIEEQHIVENKLPHTKVAVKPMSQNSKPKPKLKPVPTAKPLDQPSPPVSDIPDIGGAAKDFFGK